MYKLKIAFISLSMLLGFNIQAVELTQYVTPKNVAAGLATAGTIYASYKIYKARCAKKVKQAEELEEALQINNQLKDWAQNYKIDKNTVIAFDIHDVIAKYDVLRMVKKAVLHPLIALSSLRHPGIFKMIAQQVKKGASVQEMFEAIEAAYPGNETIKNITKLAIDISAQLKPIQATINIAKKLIANGYTVVFVSNMEPKLFERFIEDFPEFKDCRSMLPNSENQWIKKPSAEYFEMVRLAFVEHHHRLGHLDGIEEDKKQMLQEMDSSEFAKHFAYSLSIPSAKVIFIDDRLKNVKPADKCGIPSLVYLSPTQLASDLRALGADLN